MLNEQGFEPEEWNAARAEATAVLIAVAKRRGRIPYSDLVSQIKAVEIDPHDNRLFQLLGQISVDEDAAGRGMLSAIVVHKHGDMQPGPGFFELARSLGRDVRDPLVCWIGEFNKVHDYWANKSGTK